MSVHRDGLPPFNCVKCEKKFYRLDRLKRHAKIHKGPPRLSRDKVDVKGKLMPRYVCKVCKKAFARASGLVRHKKSHREMVPYKAPFVLSTVHKVVDKNWMIVRDGVLSTKGLNAVHQFKLPLVELSEVSRLDKEVCRAFTNLVDILGSKYHIDVTFTAVVDCGRYHVGHVDKRLFTELLGGPLLVMDISDTIRGVNCIKDVFKFVRKHIDYGDLVAVPSVRFHVSGVEQIVSPSVEPTPEPTI